MRPMDLLIVDDNAFQRRVLGRQLRTLGHAVREAVDGGDGLAVIAAERPAAVFTDLLMPVMDGFAFLAECAVRHPGLPVFVLSADIQAASRERALALGARGFLNKPFTPESLQAALAGLG
jgi:two-component system chemotaxis response regulator CheY